MGAALPSPGSLPACFPPVTPSSSPSCGSRAASGCLVVSAVSRRRGAGLQSAGPRGDGAAPEVAGRALALLLVGGTPCRGLVQTHRTGPEQGCDGSPRVLAGVGGGGRVRRQGAPGVKAMLCPGAAPSRAAPIAAARLTGSSALKSKVMNQEGGSCVLRPCSGCSGRQVPVSQSCKCSHLHTGLRPQDFSFRPLLPPREQPQCGWPAGPQRPCLPA